MQSLQTIPIYNNKPGIVSNEDTVLNLFKSKIRDAIKHKKEISIYCAVGFFFFNGLSELIEDLRKLYDKNLVKEFKLLMGRETTRDTKEMLKLITNDATNLTNEDYLFLKELHNKNIFQFKIYTDKRFHSKMYIFKANNIIEDVYAGSANLTRAGLTNNIELVVPTGASNIERENYEIFFNELWKKGTDELEELKTIDIIKQGATTKAFYLPPKEFFCNLLKIMDKEYLLSNPSLEIEYLAEFQKMSYYYCLEKLHNYGGCILANSVGLGKTDVACAISKYYNEMNKKVLIIHPPNIKHQWIGILKKVGLNPYKDVDLLSMGVLQSKDFKPYNYNKNYDLIIIDEAHNFRNRSSNRRKNLDEVIKINQNIHTLLLSATPINTSLDNYISLIELFTLKPSYNSKFENMGILTKINTAKKYIKNKDTINAVTTVRDLIKEFTVRIEWIDVINHFKDDLIKIAGIDNFEMPEVQPVEYSYNKDIVKAVFDRVVNYLEHLNFEYAKLWDEEGYKEDKYLLFWYKWRLYKRLESSIYAFKKSLKKYIERNEYLLNAFECINHNKLVTTPDIEKLFPKDRLETIYSTYSSLDDDIKKTIMNNIKNDIEITKIMLERVNSIENLLKKDDKVRVLINILKKENKPTIIFSESKDTVLYLKSKLESNGFSNIGVAYGGDKGGKINKKKIQESFNNGKFDILITTDTLSEGVNLPRADVVINFDLPYNPVRLIQRAGRAIRLNNPKHIKIYNFKPDESIDKELELCERLKERVENIAVTVGLEFLIWAVEQKKIDKFSDENRELVYNCIKEYKNKLASSGLEELERSIGNAVSKEDYVLREYINQYNISKESILIYYKKYSKPIYTSLKRDYKEDDYFVVLKYRGNNYYCGELSYHPIEYKSPLTNKDFKIITEMINSKVNEIDNMFIGTKVRVDKLTREIKKLCNEDNQLRRWIISKEGQINTLPRADKEKVIAKLKEYNEAPEIFKSNDKSLKIITDLNSIVNKRNVQITMDKPELVAVIKYKV
ncbi:helicase-related protein [Methanothermococcus okinawensis]|uniref:Helicase domain-containing protein n=1 Tax=Methanothermococcus okinawensis (strain DSM 14208 / JCM 11175 / IH1) TaxID=647113 RepID=F8AP20_METOI|nr:helicase-related protein [Methanothermococcus okinawensis]AEH07588.1 helicase domain-containing protein [Methanothermococcus okinawensis IH1]